MTIRETTKRVAELDALAKQHRITWINDPIPYKVECAVQCRIDIDQPDDHLPPMYLLFVLSWRRPMAAVSQTLVGLWRFALDAWPDCDIAVTRAAIMRAMDRANLRADDARFAAILQPGEIEQ